MRLVVLLYGVVSYALFLCVFLYAIGFVGGFGVPKSIDGGAVGDKSTAFLINAVLLSVFAIQHSVMARPAFKARWIKVVGAAAERSTYVMATNLLFIALFWLWRPMPDSVWHVEGAFATVLWVGFCAGWLTVLVSTFLIDHFDLFGVRQVLLHFRGAEYTPPSYVERSLYRFVRHPIMLGFLVAFWCAPSMSEGHLLFTVMSTAYVVVAIHIEERDLVNAHGDAYR
ncbi:MAG: isoprenylcysteine carboxylmethyltransferase family protein, partial [Planctomycetes bacterium]|nr:isoprenylcysteine carboxylmethyltransferase family protein [Planctomycetota bacterium]